MSGVTGHRGSTTYFIVLLNLPLLRGRTVTGPQLHAGVIRGGTARQIQAQARRSGRAQRREAVGAGRNLPRLRTGAIASPDLDFRTGSR